MFDGEANTLLLSENIQAGLSTDTEKADVGMVWWREPAECSLINRCTDVGPRPQDIKYARPSSYHKGVVIASFCDGHVKQLSDDIDYEVYQRLMAPYDRRAGLPVNIMEDPILDWWQQSGATPTLVVGSFEPCMTAQRFGTHP